MSRPKTRSLLLPLLLLPVALLLAGCGGGAGGDGVKISEANSLHQAAIRFNQTCGACHTLSKAGTYGSSSEIAQTEYKDGPNFDQRLEDYQDVLYAIRNGGFSSGPMPANIVTGRQAEEVACFVATYSGGARKSSTDPGAVNQAETQNCKTRLAQK